MATTERSEACEALHPLFGVMGETEPRPQVQLWPSHEYINGRCRHCHSTNPKDGQERHE